MEPRDLSPHTHLDGIVRVLTADTYVASGVAQDTGTVAAFAAIAAWALVPVLGARWSVEHTDVA